MNVKKILNPSQITSPTNPKIKLIRSLRDRNKREKYHAFVVEGFREIAMALRTQIKFQELLICPDDPQVDKEKELLRELSALKIPIYEVSKQVFLKISFGDRKEGILAICETRSECLNDIEFRETPFIVIVENLEKPGNLGAVLRSCDGAGVDGVIVCDGRTDIYNPNVIRSSLGTVFSNKVISATNKETLAFLRKNNMTVIVTLPQAKKIYSECDLKVPLAIVFGSEQKGLSDFWVHAADLQAKIPMKGKADSLNASVSAAVFIFEAVRQRSS